MELAWGAWDSVVPRLEELIWGGQERLERDTREDLRNIAHDQMMMFGIFKEQGLREELLEQGDKKFVSICAREMRELCYDLEDVFDSFFLMRGEAEDGRVQTNLRLRRVKHLGANTISLCGMVKKKARSLHQHVADGRRHQLTDAIREIKGRSSEVLGRLLSSEVLGRLVRFDFELPLRNLKTGTVDPCLPALYRNERELVGIDEPRDEVIRMLTQGEVKVVSIVGLGGVGKTTLAKAVYNRLQAQFDCGAFVSVSQNPDSKKVCEDILHELDGNKDDYMSIGVRSMDILDYFHEISGLLRNKSYLIVLDDVWHTDTWNTIEHVLPHNHPESRIITTSRISRVAHRVVGGASYTVRPLSRGDSEKLFYKRIFGGQGIAPEDSSKLAEVSYNILKKCGGLPLAIITAASVLASKPWEEWSEVYNSIASRHEPNRYMDTMTKVLSLSYYHLPSHLKMCLLHLSAFPEDCWIDKDFLIRRWIAEGFVVVDGRGGVAGGVLFEKGETYFHELVDRSMIQVENRYSKDPGYGCRVHHSVSSLIRSLSSEESFSILLDDEHDHHTSPDSNNARMIALHGRSSNKIAAEANISWKKLRSFNASLLSFIDGMMPQLSSFPFLRVLALEYCTGMNSHHLKQIGSLVHLRYLGLVGAGVLELPEEALGGLRLLQTLDLRETDIEQWPRTISKLEQLMCLCADRTRTVPHGIGSLRSLEDLRLHHVSGDSAGNLTAELRRLEGLRVLVLGFDEMGGVQLDNALSDSFRNHSKIQRLEIYCEQPTRTTATYWRVPPLYIRQLVLGGLLFYRLPSWIRPSDVPNLSHLHLGVEVLEDGDLVTLGRLPELRSLVLMVAPPSYEQYHPITLAGRGSHDYVLFRELNFFSTNMAVRFENGLGGPLMPNLEHVELHVRVAQCAYYWLSSLANLKSLEKVRVLLNCRGASTAETEEAQEKLRRATGVHPNRLKVEVTKPNGNDEVPLIDQFRFKNPRFEALRSEMEKMLTSRQVQVQPANDSDEIVPAMAASE